MAKMMEIFFYNFLPYDKEIFSKNLCYRLRHTSGSVTIENRVVRKIMPAA